MARMEPATIAANLEVSGTLPPGDEERFLGYGVMAAPFSSGDLLAMRRFTTSSLGHGYTTVWHRDPRGVWTLYSNCDPRESCARYIGSAVSRTIETPIGLSWPAPRRLELTISDIGLEWTLELAQTPATRALNALGRALPDRLWRDPRVLDVMSRMAGRVLHAGRLALAGHLPNGQAFVANPKDMWLIRDSHATLAGRDLGTLAPLPEQAHLGDFWIPQRPLFAFARAFFEPLDETRHHLVTHAAPLPA